MTKRPLVASYIHPTWAGEIGAILAAGPSIEGLDLSPLDRMRVIAINRAWTIYPKAHTAMGGDLRYFRTVNDWSAFKGAEIVCFSPESWKQTPVSDDPRTIHVGRGVKHGIETDRRAVSGRETCVLQGISYLVHRGVRAIVLVGIDLKAGPGGRRYAFSTEAETQDHARRYRLMFEIFKTIRAPLRALNIPVYNCSPTSRLCDLWGYTPLSEVR